MGWVYNGPSVTGPSCKPLLDKIIISMVCMHKAEVIVAADAAALFFQELANLINLNLNPYLGINEYTSLCNSFEWPRSFIRE